VSWGSSNGEKPAPTAAESTGIPLYDIYYPADKDKDKGLWPHHVCERDTPIKVNDAVFREGSEGLVHDTAVRLIVHLAPVAQAGDAVTAPSASDAIDDTCGDAAAGGGHSSTAGETDAEVDDEISGAGDGSTSDSAVSGDSKAGT